MRKQLLLQFESFPEIRNVYREGFTILPVKHRLMSGHQKQALWGSGLFWKLLLTIFSYHFRGTKSLWNCNFESRTFKTCSFLINICNHQCVSQVKRWCGMQRQILKANYSASLTISQGGEGEKNQPKPLSFFFLLLVSEIKINQR